MFSLMAPPRSPTSYRHRVIGACYRMSPTLCARTRPLCPLRSTAVRKLCALSFRCSELMCTNAGTDCQKPDRQGGPPRPEYPISVWSPLLGGYRFFAAVRFALAALPDGRASDTNLASITPRFSLPSRRVRLG